ncbi:MAG TPA: 3-dehydroquinate synthase [Roseiflexaceae bacterium]|nr:3-dehydroquinate synthase [Roseiflexaceae bacterium]HEU5103675.1 3-dehydroquinate synthase [Roseiflexaceae bacterium]
MQIAEDKQDTLPLTITTPAGSYDVLVGQNLLDELPARLQALDLRGTLWLISDSAVYPHYGPGIDAGLRAAGYRVASHSVPSGEGSKDLAVASQLYDWMIGGGVERRDAVLALGGGVVGDLAGFVAATVLRGVALIQLPTTLLAMVDSALGGKTGVNHPLGKNLIGAFHQPRLVLSDTTTLATLPPRELRAGWAEVIKHAVIRDAGLFEELEAWNRAESSTLTPHVSSLIRRAARVKVDVVNVDERETGERMLLNYGHTLGHALEALTGYGTLLHGEAVAIGMDLAARVALRMELLGPESVERQRALLWAYGLPTRIPNGVDPARLLELTLRDKKVRAGRVRWVLPTSIGSAEVRDDVPEELVRAVVEMASAEGSPE